jgi:hypothetical protein
VTAMNSHIIAVLYIIAIVITVAFPWE